MLRHRSRRDSLGTCAATSCLDVVRTIPLLLLFEILLPFVQLALFAVDLSQIHHSQHPELETSLELEGAHHNSRPRESLSL